MDEADFRRAERLRLLIDSGRATAAAVRAVLSSVPSRERDAVIDRAFGLGPPPSDGAELPRGCVPYLPCPVDALERALRAAQVQASDTLIDIGSGAGRTAALVQLLTGANVIGVEVQPGLVQASRALMKRLGLTRFAAVECDVECGPPCLAEGDVFFLYCPFGGRRLEALLARLEHVAKARELRICCVDLPLSPPGWLTPVPLPVSDVAVYRASRGGPPRARRPWIDGPGAPVTAAPRASPLAPPRRARG